MDYKVHISETGTEYNETIEVATEKQTELFKVPAHNDVDESNILHDFKTVSLFVLASSGVKTLGFIQSSIKPKKVLNQFKPNWLIIKQNLFIVFQA